MDYDTSKLKDYIDDKKLFDIFFLLQDQNLINSKNTSYETEFESIKATFSIPNQTLVSFLMNRFSKPAKVFCMDFRDREDKELFGLELRTKVIPTQGYRSPYGDPKDISIEVSIDGKKVPVPTFREVKSLLEAVNASGIVSHASDECRNFSSSILNALEKINYSKFGNKSYNAELTMLKDGCHTMFNMLKSSNLLKDLGKSYWETQVSDLKFKFLSETVDENKSKNLLAVKDKLGHCIYINFEKSSGSGGLSFQLHLDTFTNTAYLDYAAARETLNRFKFNLDSLIHHIEECTFNISGCTITQEVINNIKSYNKFTR